MESVSNGSLRPIYFGVSVWDWDWTYPGPICRLCWTMIWVHFGSKFHSTKHFAKQKVESIKLTRQYPRGSIWAARASKDLWALKHQQWSVPQPHSREQWVRDCRHGQQFGAKHSQEWIHSQQFGAEQVPWRGERRDRRCEMWGKRRTLRITLLAVGSGRREVAWQPPKSHADLVSHAKLKINCTNREID